MKKLNDERLLKITGGGKISTSMVVCGGMGLMYSFIPVVGWFVGAAVAITCAATWDDLEDSDPTLVSW